MAGKRGRPALRAGEGKTERLHVLVTPLERDTLRTAAAAADVSEGEYVRRAVAYCVAAGVPLRHVTVGALLHHVTRAPTPACHSGVSADGSSASAKPNTASRSSTRAPSSPRA